MEKTVKWVWFAKSKQEGAYVKMYLTIQWASSSIVNYFFGWTVMNKVTVQPLIYYIRKPASKLSVAAMQLVFTSFHKWKAIPPKKTSQ